MSEKPYGGPKDEAALVPGTLRVYRHFAVDLRRGQIYPMNIGPNHLRLPSVYRPGLKTHWAMCMKPMRSVMSFEAPELHPAPDPTCQCGFYAHYDPASDFYPDMAWGRAWAEMAGIGATNPDLAIAFGVCEVSGLTVMGNVGVRAQKIEIKALALDWAKHVSTSRASWRVEEADGTEVYYTYGLNIPKIQGMVGSHQYFYAESVGRADELEVAEGNFRLKPIARRYGAEAYDDASLMVEDFPKADVSALGVKEAPPRNSAGQNVFHATQPFRAALNGYIPKTRVILDEAVKSVSAAAEAVDDFQRALLAKQNRPAPPGTGIDRRKRKL